MAEPVMGAGQNKALISQKKGKITTSKTRVLSGFENRVTRNGLLNFNPPFFFVLQWRTLILHFSLTRSICDLTAFYPTCFFRVDASLLHVFLFITCLFLPLGVILWEYKVPVPTSSMSSPYPPHPSDLFFSSSLVDM